MLGLYTEITTIYVLSTDNSITVELVIELGSVNLIVGLAIASTSPTVTEYDSSSMLPLCIGGVQDMSKYGRKKFETFVRALMSRLPGGFDRSVK